MIHHPLSEPSPPCTVCYVVAALVAVLLFLALGATFAEGYR